MLALSGLMLLVCFAPHVSLAQQTGADYKKLSVEQTRARNYKEAERILGECIKVEPRNAECFYRRGLVRQIDIGFGLALEDFNAALQLMPNSHVLLTARGRLFVSMKRPDEAMTDLSRALQIMPEHAEAYYIRGNVLREKGMDDMAVADYTHAVKLDPKNELAFVFRGRIYAKQGDKDKAIADYTGAIAAKPENGSNYYDRGKIYFAQEKTELAEADFRKAVELDPKMKVRVDSLKLLAASKKFIADSEARPKTPLQAANTAGYRHLSNKEWDPAIVEFTKVIELNPAYHWGYIYRSRAYRGKGMFDLSLADLNKGLSMITPVQAATFERERAEIYMLQGKNAMAVNEMNRIITAETKPSEFNLLTRGRIHAKMGNKQLARADFEKALSINQHLKAAQEELAKLGI